MPKLPPGSRAEQVEYARNLIRQQELEAPSVRFSRSTRRVAVVGLTAVFGVAGVLLAAVVANVVAPNKLFAAFYFLLGIEALIVAFLGFAVGRLNQRTAALDERERSLRDHAFALAYRILSVILGVCSLGAIIATAGLHWSPTVNSAVGLAPFLVVLIWFIVGLPLAVLGWTLPDPEPES
jgi:hypothetical protein